MMIKTFKYRLYPNRSQRVILTSTLDTCRELYNMALEQKRYQRITAFEQIRQVTQLRRECQQFQLAPSALLQDVIRRLDRAFGGFFRRCKQGSKPGFPRFKGRTRYDSMTFRDKTFRLAGSRVQLQKIGSIKLKLSRPCIGEFRTCTIKRQCGNWYAYFSVKLDSSPLPVSTEAIGIDVGIESFAALSDGSFIGNPRFRELAQKQMRRVQRKIARRVKGSYRRKQALLALHKIHLSVANRRSNFLHKETTKLIKRYGVLAIEDINVLGLSRSFLAKQVHDVSWGQFFKQLAYKAEDAGRQLVAVDCRGTSQECPVCGHRKKKALSEREHKCLECGLVLHRDTAAAQVILARIGPAGANERRINA